MIRVRGERLRAQENLDVLIAVDESNRRVDGLRRDFCKADLRLSEKYGAFTRANRIKKGFDRKGKSHFLL